MIINVVFSTYTIMVIHTIAAILEISDHHSQVQSYLFHTLILLGHRNKHLEMAINTRADDINSYQVFHHPLFHCDQESPGHEHCLQHLQMAV